MNSSNEKTVEFPEELSAKPLPSRKNITFPRSSRWYIFFLFIFVCIFTSIDQGIIPTAIKDIKAEMNISDSQYGLLSSFFYLGKIFGSLVFIAMINLANRKFIMIVSLLSISASLFFFITFNHFAILFLTRVIIGFFQIFFIIYFPVWCDQFGIRQRKTCMITTIQISMPMGIMTGCLFGTFLNWRLGIMIEIGLTLFIAFFFLFVNNQLFSANIFEQAQAKTSIYYEYSKKFLNEKGKDGDPCNSADRKEEEGIWSMFLNKHFLFCCLSRAFLFFPLTAMQAWTIDYMETVLEIQDQKLRLLSFAIITASSPTIGTVLGGFIGTRIGGYESRRATIACVLLYLGSCCGVMMIPFTNTIWSFTSAFCLCLIFCVAIMPILTGIIISSVPHCLRGSANSVVSLVSNLFGHMPAPFAYGFINEMYKKEHPRLAMTVVLYVSFVCLAFLVLAAIYREKDKGKDKATRKDEEKNATEKKEEVKFIERSKLKKMSLINNALGEIYGNAIDVEHDNSSTLGSSDQSNPSLKKRLEDTSKR